MTDMAFWKGSWRLQVGRREKREKGMRKGEQRKIRGWGEKEKDLGVGG